LDGEWVASNKEKVTLQEVSESTPSRRPFDVFLVFGAWRSVGGGRQPEADGGRQKQLVLLFSLWRREEGHAPVGCATGPRSFLWATSRQWSGVGVKLHTPTHTADQFLLPAQCLCS